MPRRLLVLQAVLLIATLHVAQAQERFELAVPSTTTRSTAELTATTLTINHQGNVSVYSRDPGNDIPGYLGFQSTTLRKLILWPTSGMGSMQLADIPRFGAPQFAPSQMQITRVAGPIGAGPIGAGPIGAGPIGAAPAPQGGGPVDAAKSYRLTNAFLGPGLSLAADRRGKTGMAASGDFDAQLWRFVAAGPQTYRITNDALGDRFSLAAQGRDLQPTMEATDPRSTAQLWRITAWGLPAVGAGFRITNEALGAGWSLDNVNGGANEPVLAPTDNVTGQLWALTKPAVDTTLSYRLTNAFLGAGRSLDTDRRGRTRMAPSGAVDTQSWRFVAAGPQTYRLTNDALGDKFSLAATGRDSQPTMEPTDLRSTAQLWRLTPWALPTSGAGFRITNEALGAGWALDNDGGGSNEPLVGASGDFNGQLWTLTELGPAQAALPGLSGLPAMALRAPRQISRRVVPNPPLEPVTIELQNKHGEDLWVLVTDLRDATQTQRVSIPSGKSASIQLERDAGSQAIEVWEVPAGLGQIRTEERVTELPPQSWYDLSVYELFVQSITKNREGGIEDIKRSPKSVGLIKIPAGDKFPGGRTDIYAAARRQGNPGAVRRIDPAEWLEPAASDDPLQNLPPARR